jgi:hypothetical protein
MRQAATASSVRRISSSSFFSSFGCRKLRPSSARICSSRAPSRQAIDSNVGPSGIVSHVPAGSVLEVDELVDVELDVVEVVDEVVLVEDDVLLDDDVELVVVVEVVLDTPVDDVVDDVDVLVLDVVEVVVGGGPSVIVTVPSICAPRS